jgi:para-aminobenzoate synthetase/4-amino-4-deoxychorismate lyase
MKTLALQPGQALVYSRSRRGWLYFSDPAVILTAGRHEDVVPLLREVERLQADHSWYAAGYLAYEAGPAFDPAMPARPLASFPYAWFGLYSQPPAILALAEPGGPTGLPRRLSDWAPSVDRSRYDAAIAAIQEHIAGGDTYQVNYTFRLDTPYRGDAFQTFLWLARSQRSGYGAYIDAGRFALCSASPELFFTLDGGLLTSRPMKGTARRGLTLAEDQAAADWLQTSEKNRAENLMIVDMARNDIGRIARAGSVRVSELFKVEKYPTVWQMTSTVTGETRAGLTGVFQALFPAASITGAPRVRTMQIIDKLETTPRQVYCGTIGYSAPGQEAQFNVAIRTLLIDRQAARAIYGVGGGITWDSLDSAEYDECLIKAGILTARLPVFDLLESLLWSPEQGYFLLDLHLERLAHSAAYFDYPLDRGATRAYLLEQAAGFGPSACKVRLRVNDGGRLQVEHEALAPARPEAVLRIGLAAQPVNSQDPFLYHKTTHRQVYTQAKAGCPAPDQGGWDDCLLWNERGEITETTTCNVLIERDGQLYTPPTACGLLPGVHRAWLLAQGVIREAVISREEVRRNPNLILINSVRGRRPGRLYC